MQLVDKMGFLLMTIYLPVKTPMPEVLIMSPVTMTTLMMQETTLMTTMLSTNLLNTIMTMPARHLMMTMYLYMYKVHIIINNLLINYNRLHVAVANRPDRL